MSKKRKLPLWFVVHDDMYHPIRMCVVKAKSPKAAKLQAQEDFMNTGCVDDQEYDPDDMEVQGLRHLKDGWIY